MRETLSSLKQDMWLRVTELFRVALYAFVMWGCFAIVLQVVSSIVPGFAELVVAKRNAVDTVRLYIPIVAIFGWVGMGKPHLVSSIWGLANLYLFFLNGVHSDHSSLSTFSLFLSFLLTVPAILPTFAGWIQKRITARIQAKNLGRTAMAFD